MLSPRGALICFEDMARIILGVGTSHGPMLSVGPEYWTERVPADKAHPAHPFRGKTYKFDEIVELRKGEGLDVKSSPEQRQMRYDRRCRGRGQRSDGDL